MNMLLYRYHTCHMTQDMLYLPYGKERELNDGARTSSASQGAWMEPVQAQEIEQRISLRAQVEARRNLHHVSLEIARIETGGGTEENQSIVTLAILSATPRPLSSSLRPLDSSPLVTLPVNNLSTGAGNCQWWPCSMNKRKWWRIWVKTV